MKTSCSESKTRCIREQLLRKQEPWAARETMSVCLCLFEELNKRLAKINKSIYNYLFHCSDPLFQILVQILKFPNSKIKVLFHSFWPHEAIWNTWISITRMHRSRHNTHSQVMRPGWRKQSDKGGRHPAIVSFSCSRHSAQVVVCISLPTTLNPG